MGVLSREYPLERDHCNSDNRYRQGKKVLYHNVTYVIEAHHFQGKPSPFQELPFKNGPFLSARIT